MWQASNLLVATHTDTHTYTDFYKDIFEKDLSIISIFPLFKYRTVYDKPELYVSSSI